MPRPSHISLPRPVPSPLRIGLIGFGCVGQGLYDILQQLPEFGAEVRRIAVKNPAKPRSLPAHRFEYHAEDLLADPDLDVLVEVIDDAAEAFRLVKAALLQGRRVITANKAMLARHLPELVQLQQQFGGTLLYEAAVCGSIPILRTLDAHFSSEPLRSVSGILNGSSNYVLTRMTQEGTDYAAALAEAQLLGFAETDPTLDMAAFDPRSKAVILAAHAYGLLLQPEQVLHLGIEAITPTDIAYAQAQGYKIKVVATLEQLPDGRITALVAPTFVSAKSPLYTVEHEFNGVSVEAAFAGAQFLRGRGAGGHPTGSAVLSDLAALQRQQAYTYTKLRQATPAFTNQLAVEIYLRTPEENGLANLALTDISVEGNGPEGYFAVGYTTLATLLEQRENLRQAGALIVRTGAIRVTEAAQEVTESALAQ
jgi:homoserine dehydrogenase